MAKKETDYKKWKESEEYKKQQQLLEQQRTSPQFLDLGEPELPKPTKIITNEEGRQVGVEKPSGQTLLGLKPADVAAITRQPVGTTGTTGGVPGMAGQVVGAQEYAQAEQAQRRAEMIDIERQRLTTEEMPRRVELNPPELGATTVPLIGGIARQVAFGMVDLATKKGSPGADFLRENIGALSEDDIRNMAISEIQKEELRKGLTTSEKLGSFLEGIPGAAWASKYIDFESPRGNIETVMTDIKSMRRQISKIGSDVRMGYIDPATAKIKLDTAEQYVNFQEGRLQLLIVHSPSLEFNSDRVNKFETDILTVKETIAQAKIDVLMGVEKDPTMLDIYLKQKEQTSDEWASSDW